MKLKKPLICPTCKTALPELLQLDERPMPGDVILCVACGAVSTLRVEISLQGATDDVIAALPDDLRERVLRVQKDTLEGLAMRARGAVDDPDARPPGLYEVNLGTFYASEGKPFDLDGTDLQVWGHPWIDLVNLPVALRYALRASSMQLPMAGRVYYGHIGSAGVLMHEVELGRRFGDSTRTPTRGQPIDIKPTPPAALAIGRPPQKRSPPTMEPDGAPSPCDVCGRRYCDHPWDDVDTGVPVSVQDVAASMPGGEERR